ncbi:MAG: sialidase family protein, partial [Nitrososphaera sp.]
MKLFAVFAFISAALAAAAILLILYPPTNQDVSGQSTAPQLNTQIAGVRFDKATNLTNNTQDSVYGQVVAADNNVHVVWQDSVSSPESPDSRYLGRNYDIFMIASTDGGDSFGTPINLSMNPGFSEHPQSAAFGDSVYVVWADNASGNKEVLFVTGKSNGSDFGTTLNLSNTNSDSFNQEIAVFEENIYTVWLEEGEVNSRVVFRASHDGGKTFDETLLISEKANVGTLPKVSADGKRVHVAWSLLEDEGENGLFYSASSDGGKTFGGPKKLSDQNYFGEPQIVASTDTVYVVSGGLD